MLQAVNRMGSKIYEHLPRYDIPNLLLSLSNNIKSTTLLNLGGNEILNDRADCFANLIKVASIKLSNRRVFFNARNEFCSCSVAKTISSVVKLFPKEVNIPNFAIELINKNFKWISSFIKHSISIAWLRPLIKSTVVACAILDIIVNYKKTFPNGVTLEAMVIAIFEIANSFLRTMFSFQVIALLFETQFQILIGPIIICLGKLYATYDNAKYNLLHDRSEMIFRLTIKC